MKNRNLAGDSLPNPVEIAEVSLREARRDQHSLLLRKNHIAVVFYRARETVGAARSILELSRSSFLLPSPPGSPRHLSAAECFLRRLTGHDSGPARTLLLIPRHDCRSIPSGDGQVHGVGAT